MVLDQLGEEQDVTFLEGRSRSTQLAVIAARWTSPACNGDRWSGRTYACSTFGLARVDWPNLFWAITSPHRTSRESITTSSVSIDVSALWPISSGWHCVARNSMPGPRTT